VWLGGRKGKGNGTRRRKVVAACRRARADEGRAAAARRGSTAGGQSTLDAVSDTDIFSGGVVGTG